jgi:hypothetical protein
LPPTHPSRVWGTITTIKSKATNSNVFDALPCRKLTSGGTAGLSGCPDSRFHHSTVVWGVLRSQRCSQQPVHGQNDIREGCLTNCSCRKKRAACIIVSTRLPLHHGPAALSQQLGTSEPITGRNLSFGRIFAKGLRAWVVFLCLWVMLRKYSTCPAIPGTDSDTIDT